MEEKKKSIRDQLGYIIFETDTPAAKGFDVALLWVILISIGAVMAESLPGYSHLYYKILLGMEWFFTGLFTIEYGLRIWTSPKPLKYIFSFWGIIDLISILPTYLTFFEGSQYFLSVRVLRLLRIFRILRIGKLNQNAKMLVSSLVSSLPKISVFLFAVITIITIIGSIMYVVERGQQGFSSIPQSIYWAIVTITTVGYGDIVPHSVLGKFFSSVAMIIGYAIIAVPTGIITSEISNKQDSHSICSHCGNKNPQRSNYCNKCGKKLKQKRNIENDENEDEE